MCFIIIAWKKFSPILFSYPFSYRQSMLKQEFTPKQERNQDFAKGGAWKTEKNFDVILMSYFRWRNVNDVI